MYKRVHAHSEQVHRRCDEKDALETDHVSCECQSVDAYRPIGLRFMPHIVNVVTLVDALPVPGTGTVLPLDLRMIAAKCKAAYYAPRKFAALQLAFAAPRCRVLLFHTGRIVGTGTRGFVAARLALAVAVKELATRAGVHLQLHGLKVINTVMAADLDTTLNCEQFASAHPDVVHFDRRSFVGLSWRPVDSSVSIEAYSTGKLNIPGATKRQVGMRDVAALIPKLLLHSTSSELRQLATDDACANETAAS